MSDQVPPPIEPTPPGGPTPPIEPTPPGGPPPMAPLDLEPVRSGSRTPFIIVGGVLLVIIVVVLVALLVGRKSSGYTDADRQKFLAACTAGGGQPVESTCECIYDQLSATVPYDRYVAIDSDLQQQAASSANQPLNFPPEVESVRVACVAKSAGSSVPSAPSESRGPGSSSPTESRAPGSSRVS